MWLSFLTNWNDISFFYKTKITLAMDYVLYTDASINDRVLWLF